MKKIKDLTKEELLSLIYTSLDVNDEEYIECACCGDTSKAKYYYICEYCEKELV